MISFFVPNMASKRKFEIDKGGNTSKSVVENEVVHTRVISKEMYRMQYFRNRTPDVQENVIVLHCSPPSVE